VIEARGRGSTWPKASGKVCRAAAGGSGRRVQPGCGPSAANPAAVTELAEDTWSSSVERVTRRGDVTATGGSGTTCWRRAGPRGCTGQRPRRRERPGRAKTDKLDAVLLAKLTEKGMLRRRSCPYRDPRPARLQPAAGPISPTTRVPQVQRLEKLLEYALVKLSDGGHPTIMAVRAAP